jgi:hypothetical protein
MKILSIFAAVAAMVVLTAGSAHAQWGDLKLRFVVDGKAPAPAPLDITKDAAVCANPKNPKLVNESFVVGKDGGIKNVIVFLVPEKGSKVKIHNSYAASEKAEVELDNKSCRFEPHVALVRTGQTLVLKNSDPVGHNSKLDFFANTPQNPIIPANGAFPIKPADLSKAEKRPTPVSCSIHPWMSGYVLVQDHPYMAVSDENGVVEIKNVPAGKHTFQAWQEGVGYVVSSGKAKFVKGKADITIKDGANDLGEFKVKPPK